jgi:hypothetical protein
MVCLTVVHQVICLPWRQIVHEYSHREHFLADWQ